VAVFLAEQDMVADHVAATIILAALGLPFLLIYIIGRQQWWALIPGLVLLGVAVAVFLAGQDVVADHVVPTIILAAVGLPFLLIYIIDRQHWWALIPAFILGGVAAGVFLEGAGAITGPAVAGFILGGVSLGFLFTYVADRELWWALIPAGITGLMAIVFLLATAAKFILPMAIILFGLLLLYRGLRRGGQRPHQPERPIAPYTPITAAAEPEGQRPPRLGDQIEAASAEESVIESESAIEPSAAEKPLAPDGVPPGPDIPEPPKVPSSPDR
jgi:hypothetical protein